MIGGPPLGNDAVERSQIRAVFILTSRRLRRRDNASRVLAWRRTRGFDGEYSRSDFNVEVENVPAGWTLIILLSQVEFELKMVKWGFTNLIGLAPQGS
jgi:hypothetical protein